MIAAAYDLDDLSDLENLYVLPAVAAEIEAILTAWLSLSPHKQNLALKRVRSLWLAPANAPPAMLPTQRPSFDHRIEARMLGGRLADDEYERAQNFIARILGAS